MASRNKRKGNKTLPNPPSAQCDTTQLQSYICSNNDITNEGTKMIDWIRSTSTSSIYNVTTLQDAMTQGYFSICKGLIEEQISLISYSSIPHPLCIALGRGNLDIIKLLLEAGADVNLPFGEIYPLAYALNDPDSCTVDIVKAVIEAGFPKDGVIHKSSKKTALHVAAILDKQPIVEYLLSISADPNSKDSKGLTPLHYAAQFNSIEVIHILVKHGARIDIECEGNSTPLLYGIAGPHYNVVKTLIELGASINNVNRHTMKGTPLHFAAATCQFRIVQLLLEKGANVHCKVLPTKRSALHAAAMANPGQAPENKIALNCIIESLIKHGVDINATDKNGCTPLQVAIASKNFSVAKILITSGSLLNNCFFNNETRIGSLTTFHLAAGTANKDLIKLCLEYGADMYSKDVDGLNPVHSFVKYCLAYEENFNCKTTNDDVGILKLFWNHGFPFDKIVHPLVGNTLPEEIAAAVKKQKLLFNGLKSMELKIVEKAIDRGAELKCCSTDVPYPLHLIASKGNEEILALFLSKGVNPNCFDKRGETPLHAAAKYGHFRCCLKLLEYGAFFNIRTKTTHKTPLELAQEKNHVCVIKLLNTMTRVFGNFKKGSVSSVPDIRLLHGILNCAISTGDTLLTRALKLQRNEQVLRLMDLRLNAKILE